MINFSGKFRLCSGRKPPLRWLEQDSLAATNKLCWQLSNSASAPSFVRRRPAPLPMCRHMTGSDAHRWGVHFRRVLLRIAATSAYRSQCGNMCGLMKLAIKLVGESEYIFAPLDKEPGFAATHVSSMQSFEQAALPANFYIPRHIQYINFRSIATEYHWLASDIARFSDDTPCCRQ